MTTSASNPRIEEIRRSVRSSYDALNQLIDGPLSTVDSSLLYQSPGQDEWTVMENIAHIIEFMPYWADESAKLIAQPGQNFGRTQQHEGRLRALAVSALRRSPAAPELPTMAESGFPGFDATTWYALMAPAGTPPAIVERLQRELARSLAQPEFRKKFDDVGMEPITRTFAEFVASLPGEAQQWAKVIKEAGIKPGE